MGYIYAKKLQFAAYGQFVLVKAEKWVDFQICVNTTIT